MNDEDLELTSDTLRILHGARGLPPDEAVEALRPFLEAMRVKRTDNKLAEASFAAVTELVRSLKENHAASNDLWLWAIETTVSFEEGLGASDATRPR